MFGVVAGLIFGNDPLYLITSYVLPIMGGGAGAGAVPMAQVYSDATGQDSAGYLSFCMAILALGNIVAILMAVVMDLIGRAFPKMTGPRRAAPRQEQVSGSRVQKTRSRCHRG